MQSDTQLMQIDTELMQSDTQLMQIDTELIQADTELMQGDTELMQGDTELMQDDTELMHYVVVLLYLLNIIHSQMKKLTSEEFNSLPLRRGKQSVVTVALKTLSPGDKLQISKKECRSRRGPSQTIKRLQRRSGRTYVLYTVLDGSGWVVERVE